MKKAIAAAKVAGREVAFTLSDAFVIERHGDDFRALIDAGDIDILFANEVELRALTGDQDFEAGLAKLAPKVPTLVVTRSEKGAVGISGETRAQVLAEPIDHVVDTTGAGDMFAAGFLYARVKDMRLDQCLHAGAVCAREIISHYGARPEADLKALLAEKLG